MLARQWLYLTALLTGMSATLCAEIPLEVERELADLRHEIEQLRATTDRWAPPITAGDTGVPGDQMTWTAASTDAAAGHNTVIKYPNVTVNGAFQADAGFFHQDAGSVASFRRIEDGADFRRARVSAKGAVNDSTNYNMQFDFGAFGRPTFTDVWLETVNLPWLGNVRVGQWKQPFSLEVASSYRYTTFLERSLLFTTFTPFRHIGIGCFDHSASETATWAVSGFRTGQDQFGGSISNDGGWGTAERVTWLPWYDEACGGSAYLHLGAGHFYSNPPRDTFNFRTIPEFFVGEQANGAVGTAGAAVPGVILGTPFFAETGPLALRHYNVLGGELLWVEGPFSLQSEVMVAVADQTNGVQATLSGCYAQIGYFLTGEHRPYDRKAGAIDRVRPFEDFYRFWAADGGICRGRGAIEVAVRYSYLDLNDNDVAGGRLTDWTAGLNWYWNAYTKLVFNYIHARADDPAIGESDTHIFAARAQVDF